MSLPYVRVNLEQGSDEWLAWRTCGIGASEAPAILGENPWKSREQVLAEKCGLAERSATSPAMAFGTATEPEARASYVATLGVPVEPVCVQSLARDWLRASLDGFSVDGRTVVEIKCGTRVHARTAKTRQPPRHYVGQLQHILAVTGLEAIDFWCYLPGRPPVHVKVARDEAFIRRMLELEEAFWAEVVAFRTSGRA
jgi:putative phage-type endonuclease